MGKTVARLLPRLIAYLQKLGTWEDPKAKKEAEPEGDAEPATAAASAE